MKNPCYGCQPPTRNAECHSVCEEYTEWKKIHDAERNKKHQEKLQKWGWLDARESAIRRGKRERKSRS